jgi:arylsulfatase A-like enzyme
VSRIRLPSSRPGARGTRFPSSRHRTPRGALSAVLLALAVCACAPRPARQPPIVLISIDTLRSDRLPAYGHRGLATPAIDALRGDGILFRSAFSPIPLTLPAHTSLFSGRLPSEHGVRDNAGYRVEESLAPWLPSLAGSHGYTTAGFVSAYVLRRETGMARGFDAFDDEMRPRRDVPLGGVSRSGSETVDRALAWLRTVGDRPFFLFLHLYEPHSPYTPPEPFASRYPGRPYDGEIAEADRLVGVLVAELRRLGRYDPAWVVLLSDHGEGLDDHGELEHGVLLYREALQVPLIVKLPQGERRGDEVTKPAQLVDLLPALAPVVGAELAPGLHGSSLLELPAERPLYGESYYGQLHYGWHPLRSLIARGRHLIASSELELFDLAADPAETRSLFPAERRLALELKAELEPLSAPLVSPAAEDDEAAKKLAALGYLSGASSALATDPSSLPTPRSQIGLLRDLAAAGELLRQGELDRAEPALERLVATNREMSQAWSLLGTLRGKRGRWPQALEAFERAFESSQRDASHAPGVARALIETGRIEDGIELVGWALEAGLDDGAIVATLARRLVELGRRDQAIALLRSAARGPTEGPAKAALAELLATGGQAQEALSLAQDAVKLMPLDGEAHEQLALAQLSLGQFEAAHVRREDAERQAERVLTNYF